MSDYNFGKIDWHAKNYVYLYLFDFVPTEPALHRHDCKILWVLENNRGDAVWAAREARDYARCYILNKGFCSGYHVVIGEQ